MDSISKKYNKQKIILGLILTVLATLSLILSSKTTYASTYVMDKAGVLNQQTVEEITQINESDLSKVTGHPEIAVITVKTTGDEAIEDYAQEQAQKYHIGRKGWNNGVLFVIATKDRKVRMQTGYGTDVWGRVSDLQRTGLYQKGSENQYFAGGASGGFVCQERL